MIKTMKTMKYTKIATIATIAAVWLVDLLYEHNPRATSTHEAPALVTQLHPRQRTSDLSFAGAMSVLKYASSPQGAIATP